MNAPHTTKAAAAAVQVHERTVQRWCRDHLVAHCRTPGGRFRFTDDQLAALVDRYSPSVHHPEVDTPNPWGQQLTVVTPIAAKRGRGAA